MKIRLNTMNAFKAVGSILSFLFCFNTTAQQLKLAELFNEGAVLQRNTNVRIWGKGKSLSEINLQIQGKQFVAKSDKSGEWKMELSPLKAGGPYTMTVFSGKDTIRLKEIYVGEVWIAGGQSNMEFQLSKSDSGKTEIARGCNKNIHFLKVPFVPYPGAKSQGDMKWNSATYQSVSYMSAVAYYFAKEIVSKLKIPIGIICCYRGGSVAETWMSKDAILKYPETKPIIEAYDSFLSKMDSVKLAAIFTNYQLALKSAQDSSAAGLKVKKWPTEPMSDKCSNRPSALYQTMLQRVVPYTIQGAIWYQGESNVVRAVQYRTLFPALIENWRTDFKNPAMPFLFVQLPGFEIPESKNWLNWPELREAQQMTSQKVKNTGMAVSLELGDKNDIHPTHKESVGKRLAANALNTVYGFKNPYAGPIYKNVQFKENKAIISFNFIYDGLKCDGELKGFSICGADKKFVSAKAEIKNNQIVVWSDKVDAPVAVRYGWSNWTDANLKNSADFSASPFRTDNFRLLSEGVYKPVY